MAELGQTKGIFVKLNASIYDSWNSWLVTYDYDEDAAGKSFSGNAGEN